MANKEIDLVIRIDEEYFNDLKSLPLLPFSTYPEEIIYKGVPLPKGHGRLGDLSKAYDKLNEAQIEGSEEYKGLGKAKQIICDTPTIIEADKESEGNHE